MLIGHERSKGERVDVIDADHRTECECGFELEATGWNPIFRPVDDCEMVFVDLGDTPARYGAREARLVGDVVGESVWPTLPGGIWIDVLYALELHLLKVPGRQATKGLHAVNHGVGAKLGEGGDIGGELFLGLVDGAHEAFGIIYLDAPGAFDCDGFEVFRAHYGADTGASCGAVQIIDDAGKAHPTFAGDTDGGDFE